MILQNIIEKIYSKIEEFEDKDDNQEFTFCFRGEAEDYKATKLTPTLFREKKIGGSIPDKELINLITDYKIVDDKNLNPLSKAIEGQHFLALSRLLDITFCILPSIFFASSSSSSKYKDGYIYIFRFPKAYSPSSNYINKYYEKLINGEIEPYYQNFKVLSHIQSNSRIKSQSGGFILFPGQKIKKIPTIYYKRYRIEAKDKDEILKELDIFFNINESTIYPEKDKKRDLIKKRLYSISKDDSFLENSNFYKQEIDTALERISFEIHSILEDDRKKILRLLRKERRNIEEYVKILTTDADVKKEIHKKIQNEFNRLKISLKD